MLQASSKLLRQVTESAAEISELLEEVFIAIAIAVAVAIALAIAASNTN